MLNQPVYKITTNNRKRKLFTYDELPENVKPLFDYMNQNDSDLFGIEEYRFFKAYGVWFDYCEILNSPSDLKALGWDGYMNISIGACYVFKFFDKYGYDLDAPIAGYATFN